MEIGNDDKEMRWEENKDVWEKCVCEWKREAAEWIPMRIYIKYIYEEITKQPCHFQTHRFYCFHLSFSCQPNDNDDASKPKMEIILNLK